MLPARFRLSQARTGTRETAADIPFRKTGNARIFSVLFDWTCDEIVIPSTPADFPGTCRIYGEARQSICSRMRRRKQRSSSTWGRRDRPRVRGSRRAGLNPHYQIGGYHSVQLGLKPTFSTSRTGAFDIGVPGAVYIPDGRRLSANVVSEGLAGTDAKQYSFSVGS